MSVSIVIVVVMVITMAVRMIMRMAMVMVQVSIGVSSTMIVPRPDMRQLVEKYISQKPTHCKADHVLGHPVPSLLVV